MAIADIVSISPFFQVLVFGFDAAMFDAHALPAFLADNIEEGSRHEFVVRHIKAEKVLAYQVEHAYPPTWLKGEDRATIKNVEHDLILVYQKGEYLFVHISCDILSNALIDFFTQNGCQPLKADQVLALVSNDDVQLRTLGLHNVYGTTGVAPQSKSYSGYNMRDALTSTNDGGYGFSYATGVRIDPTTKKPKPLGCSVNKNKVWESWAQDIHEFIVKCEDLVLALQQGAAAIGGLSVLASPVSPGNVQLDPVFFGIDYYVRRKGLLFLAPHGHTPSADWACSYSITTNTVNVEIHSDAGATTLSLSLSLQQAEWTVDYIDPQHKAQVCLVGEDFDPKGHRKYDLVHYLNNQGNFTVIFSCGLSYRHQQYFQDNRYSNPFRKAEDTVIDWRTTDIKAESTAPGRTDTIGDAIETLHRGAFIGINDDGAGEVADYIVCPHSDKLILIHAKYSSKAKPGLRVGDLEVVCSQAVKNLPYFTSSRLGRKVAGWSSQQFTATKMPASTFAPALADVVGRIPSLDKELWIVQPGISKAKLDAAPGNKIHVLLNHVDSQCRSQDIRFRFVCSR